MLSSSRLILCLRSAPKQCRVAVVHVNQPSVSHTNRRATHRTAIPHANKVMRAGDEASAQTSASQQTPIRLPKIDIERTNSLAEECAKVHERVYAFLAREPRTKRVEQAQRQTRESLAVIGEALQRYSLDALSFSYNGGKDCLVLLILYLAALHTHATTTQTTLPPTLESVYIVSPNPFPAVTMFVEQTAEQYHLSLTRYTQPMRESFASYLDEHPHIKAIFVGTRRTDPHGAKLTHFDPTDHGWPAFVRVHPVIDWHYADIWGFLREVGVEYCVLYDQGYTSLGGTDDTHPNPALQVPGKEGVFRAAWELVEDDEERLGRDR